MKTPHTQVFSHTLRHLRQFGAFSNPICQYKEALLVSNVNELNMPSTGMCESRGPGCVCVYVCPHSHIFKGVATPSLTLWTWLAYRQLAEGAVSWTQASMCLWWSCTWANTQQVHQLQTRMHHGTWLRFDHSPECTNLSCTTEWFTQAGQVPGRYNDQSTIDLTLIPEGKNRAGNSQLTILLKAF